MKRGFTLVEIMIVMVIIFLLAAMAIPAFQKARDTSLRKKAESGERLSPAERERLDEMRRRRPREERKRIVIDGQEYYLVPANN